MRILWFSWKDIGHPHGGGAEVVTHEIASRLVRDGHEVLLLTSNPPDSTRYPLPATPYQVVRLGNRFSVYYKAYRYYKKHLRGWADLVVEEINTVPFFTKFYVREPRVLFFHQLCRQIWFHQMPIPISVIGYLAEPLYLRMLNGQKVITVSDSTKKDLTHFGFKASNISIISEGIQIDPVENLNKVKKFEKPTALSLGSMRSMKRTLDQVKAFEIAKYYVPDLQLKIAGDSSGKYGSKVLNQISNSRFKDDIQYFGQISTRKKINLLRKSHLLLATSVKEGWGLTVTEAASQGTPSAVYDVDGLRDSVQNNQTGLIVQENNPYYLAAKIVVLTKSRISFDQLQKNAWRWSKQINFDRSYKDFTKAVGAA